MTSQYMYVDMVRRTHQNRYSSMRFGGNLPIRDPQAVIGNARQAFRLVLSFEASTVNFIPGVIEFSTSSR
jgi:hypothetical protein